MISLFFRNGANATFVSLAERLPDKVSASRCQILYYLSLMCMHAVLCEVIGKPIKRLA